MVPPGFEVPQPLASECGNVEDALSERDSREQSEFTASTGGVEVADGGHVAKSPKSSKATCGSTTDGT